MLLLFNFTLLTISCFYGGHSEEVPPVPIPNTAVKLFCADGTAWETVWESRSPPFFIQKPLWAYAQRGFCFQAEASHFSIFWRLLSDPLRSVAIHVVKRVDMDSP